MATTRRIATEEDLLAMPRDGHKYELVDGEIRVSPTGNRHGAVIAQLAALLVSFVKPRHLGYVIAGDAGFRLPSKNVRCPDVSFVVTGRFPDDKVGEYLEAGVRLIWVIDPRQQRAVVYRSLSQVRELAVDDILDGEEVVPGFRCVLRDVLS